MKNIYFKLLYYEENNTELDKIKGSFTTNLVLRIICNIVACGGSVVLQKKILEQNSVD